MALREDWIVCRECEEEFNALDPYHNKYGFYNVCGDCSEPEETVKALLNYNEEGDIEAMRIVPGEHYKKVIKSLTGDEIDE